MSRTRQFSRARLLSSALLVSLVCYRQAYLDAESPPEPAIIGLIDAAELRRETRLQGYSVTERYSLQSRRFNTSAEMTAAAVYLRDEGKSYQILSRNGSATIQSRVFDRLLREEGEMSRGQTRRQALVNSENYVMRFAGEEIRSNRKCYVVQLTPRRSSTHLLKGRAWIDVEDGSLTRIEGRPTASPSFLAGRPMITRDYKKVGAFWLARSSDAVSDSFLFGRTDLHIEYVDYHINADQVRRYTIPSQFRGQPDEAPAFQPFRE